MDAKNPFSFEHVRSRIALGLRRYEGRFTVLRLPNVTCMFYGRDVGYAVERIDLDANIQAISATAQRKLLGNGTEHRLLTRHPCRLV